MPTLHMKDSNQHLAEISDTDLAHMVSVMEEESSTDKDYFIDLRTVDLLENAGASAQLITALKTALAGSEGIDVVWR